MNSKKSSSGKGVAVKARPRLTTLVIAAINILLFKTGFICS